MTSVRIDKWLWVARFFQTRALAQRACELGRIQSNGQPAKPARKIKDKRHAARHQRWRRLSCGSLLSVRCAAPLRWRKRFIARPKPAAKRHSRRRPSVKRQCSSRPRPPSGHPDATAGKLFIPRPVLTAAAIGNKFSAFLSFTGRSRHLCLVWNLSERCGLRVSRHLCLR